MSICFTSCTNSIDKLVSQLEQANIKIKTYQQQLSILMSKNDYLLEINQAIENTIQNNKSMFTNTQKTIEDNKVKINELLSSIETHKNDKILLHKEIDCLKKEKEYEVVDGYEIPINHSETYYAFVNNFIWKSVIMLFIIMTNGKIKC